MVVKPLQEAAVAVGEAAPGRLGLAMAVGLAAAVVMAKAWVAGTGGITSSPV